jgi:hypothetical protein
MHKDEPVSDGDMLDEYDFHGGVRGKYAQAYATGTNVVLLDPDVAEIFPDAESVNAALRILAELVRQQAKRSSV